MINDISFLFGSLLVLIIIVFYPTPILTAEGESLGYFSECSPGRKFEGEVIVKNEREIVIPEFYYDGRGPSVWFHAMSKGAQAGVHSSNHLSFYTLPFPGANCDRVKGHNYNGEEINLILPVSIYELETIGMFDYQSCQNYGNVSIPSNLVVEAAPEHLPVTHICPKSTFKPCLGNGETKNGGKDCKAVDSGIISTHRTDYNGSIVPDKIVSGTDYNGSIVPDKIVSGTDYNGSIVPDKIVSGTDYNGSIVPDKIASVMSSSASRQISFGILIAHIYFLRRFIIICRLQLGT